MYDHNFDDLGVGFMFSLLMGWLKRGLSERTDYGK
jgi:hypothetical protein